MGFRVLYIENEVNIKVKLNNLVVLKEGKELWIPVDDISVLIIDNLQITLTARMMSVLAEHNVGVVICDQKHLPMGYFSSYDNHSRVSKMILCQAEKDRMFYDFLWQKIICGKLENQAQVLELLEKDESVIAHLRAFLAEVRPGDPTNREAHGAKIYFNELMGTSFSRGNEDILLNAGLDYGYAICRSFLAKTCVGYGLNTQLGIHHRNEYNRFNLVDDLIEPFRPIVDIYTCRLLMGEEYFKSEHRHKLANIFNHKIEYKGRRMYLCNAMEEYVSNVASYIGGKDVSVVMPWTKNYQGEDNEI